MARPACRREATAGDRHWPMVAIWPPAMVRERGRNERKRRRIKKREREKETEKEGEKRGSAKAGLALWPGRQ